MKKQQKCWIASKQNKKHQQIVDLQKIKGMNYTEDIVDHAKIF